jgi:uncharacterized membrane protein YhaH (DUF805 family)
MNMIVTAFRHNLGNLTNFTGRDRMGLYWPYVLVLYGVQVIVSTAITLPAVLASFRTMMDQITSAARSGQPHDQLAMQNQMMTEMMQAVGAHLPLQIGLSIVFILLAAAATVRRLHDRDWSGKWLWLGIAGTAGSTIYGLWMMNQIAERGVDFMMDNMGIVQLASWLPMIAYVVLLIQLVQRGTAGPNRYGDEPLP